MELWPRVEITMTDNPYADLESWEQWIEQQISEAWRDDWNDLSVSVKINLYSIMCEMEQEIAAAAAERE